MVGVMRAAKIIIVFNSLRNRILTLLAIIYDDFKGLKFKQQFMTSLAARCRSFFSFRESIHFIQYYLGYIFRNGVNNILLCAIGNGNRFKVLRIQTKIEYLQGNNHYNKTG